ncbi:MAG TPA: CocE/NonD family hydrolase [Rhizomicrobium sp.]|nr:CocE/NonD family hydrolase [Rhizomicrobium sp.]
MGKWLAVLLLSLAVPAAGAVRELPFAPPDAGDRTALAQSMSQLAGAVLTVYREPDRATWLDNMFRLQLAAGRYTDAAQTIALLRARPDSMDPPQARARDAQYEIFARAEARVQRKKVTFADAFKAEFRALAQPLDNRTAALVMRLFNGEETGGLSLIIDQADLRRSLAQLLKRQAGKQTISLADALALIRAWQVEESYRRFMPLAAPLVNEDDARRYIVETNIRVRMPDGATVCAQIVRPRVGGRLPSLLEYTVYADTITTMSEERRSASNGYVGITGFTRGKMCSPDSPLPLEHDGADAAALIDWIAKQPWSDGRVGMFGGSYDGFTQWAATKHLPPALKAIMPSVATAPGIDMPMEGSVDLSFNFYWPLYVATSHGLDGAAFEDTARWDKLFHDWYVSGRAYRDLSVIAGTPNPVWDRWISHPDYDAYWQAMVPYGPEFARVDIPVLATTGYYDGAELGALYYFQQIPAATEHYLVIGPYTHITGQRGTVSVSGDPVDTVEGYKLDPAAKVDMGALRYQWFDYVFGRGPKPAILQDTVNYEVMGANAWRHAPSLAAMANRTIRFHPGAEKTGHAYLLSETAPAHETTIGQKIDLADRSDANRVAPGGNILDPALDTWLSLEFLSAPFDKPVEFSGLFSGTLRFVTNKKDFDFAVQLYELTPDHKYLQLSWYLARASYVADRTHRHLLETGVPQQLIFRSGRLISRKFARGSRLVVLLAAVRQPNTEINYGTGKDVSGETIADAKTQLDIRWLTSSTLDIPVRE